MSDDLNPTGNEPTPASELFAGSTESTPEFQGLLGGNWQTPVDPYVSYGSVNDEDSLGYLIGLARAMSTTDELLAIAEILGMTPLQLLMTLTDMHALFGVIAMPVLPPIALIIMDEQDSDPHGLDPEQLQRFTHNQTPDNWADGESIPDRSRGMFDELAARRAQHRRVQFDQMATGKLFRHTPNPDTVFNPLEASFAHGMVHRSMVFGQLIALGNTDLAPDADLARAFVYGRRRAEELLDPYVETPQEPGSTDPQE